MLKQQAPNLIKTKSHDKSFQTLADHHKIQGLIYYHYEDFRKDTAFKQSWLSQWALNEKYQTELALLRSHLPTQIKPVLLKGSALLGLIYQDFGSRFMSDIDLLIRPHELKEVEKTLLALNYKKLPTLKWEANRHKSEWNKVDEGQEITIELHTKLYFHIPLSDQSYELEPSHLTGFQRLVLEDQILYLSTHYALQHNFLRLYWLFDIYFMVKKYQTEIDWPQIQKRAEKLQINNSLNMNLYILKKYMNLDLSAQLKIKNRKMINIDFLWSDNMRTLRYFIVKYQTRDKPLSALRYALFWFLSKFQKKKTP